MKTLYFDCVSGASGDMILGALLDAGLPANVLRERLAALHLPGFELRVEKVEKCGIAATQVDVIVDDDVPERHLPQLVAIVQGGDLPAHVVEKSIAVLYRIGEAEAAIHSSSLDHVHLHELGGIDTIVDVVGAVSGLDALGIERVRCSPIPLGRGFTNSAHGRIPLPAPATVALLRGAPVIGSEIQAETVTPTGAALLSTLSADFGAIPAMTLSAVGYGAGRKDFAIPNVLRVLVGESAAAGDSGLQALVVLETNIDDLNPETYEYVMGRLFAAGALDVFLAPIQMKKNRPATLISVICWPSAAAALSDILFSETSTLGIRRYEVMRQALPRRSQTVETPYGPVRVKVAHWGDGQTKAAPEYEDCRKLAAQHNVPLREVYRAAVQATHEAGLL
jgi:pyridinium-3,5-bisthiocarboxylic acid mononucleotide nickel chelatase